MTVFIESLKNSRHLDQIDFTLCQVGSRKLPDQDDLCNQGWDILAPNLTIYGFDADAEACDSANADLEKKEVNWNEIHIPIALSNSIGKSILYVTKHPMCSSLYKPNDSYLERLGANIPNLMKFDFKIEVETTTLDYFCDSEEIKEIDFLQTDVQGADLDVLQGGSYILENSILAVKSEVLFAPLYSNSPLFTDVDNFMKKQGFTLFTLTTAARPRQCSPLVSRHGGQILWGDAFYMRDLIGNNTTPLKTPEHILKLACIADLMECPDYALELLGYLTLEYGSNPQYNCAKNIMEGLYQFPKLVENNLESLSIVQKIQGYIIN